MKKSLYIIAAAVIGLTACTRENLMNDGHKGCLHLGVGLEESSKATEEQTQLINNAKVSIYYADFSGLVAEYVYGEMPGTVYMPAGDYRVDVLLGEDTSENPRPISWDGISYKGSAGFKIEGGKSCNVQVEAGINCATAVVKFDNSVAENFKSGYQVKIGPDIDNALVYNSINAGKTSYVLLTGVDEPCLAWSFAGYRSKNGALINKSGVIKDLKAGKQYELTIKYTVKEGDADFDIFVETDMSVIDRSIVFEPVSTGLTPSSASEIWAAHATVHADVDEEEYSDPSKIKFRYSSDGSVWKTADATRTGEGTYEGLMSGLTAQTEYEYRLTIDGQDIGDSMTLTTEIASPIPNGSFENVSKSSSGSYTEFYNPSCSDPLSRTAWWGSGNGSEAHEGSADMGFEICVSDGSTYKDGSRSAKLQSQWAVVKFAAGNLFTGYFGGLVGTKGGKVYFGRPFEARPTKLKFWAKYSTSKMNRIDDSCPYPVSTNDYDKARVFIALGTWSNKTYGGTKDCPVLFDTTIPSTLIDFNKNESTVAYAELVLTGASGDPHNKWVEYTLNLDYKKLNVSPQYIVISCASSMYGDYFTGYDGSVLWLDKMELIYE